MRHMQKPHNENYKNICSVKYRMDGSFVTPEMETTLSVVIDWVVGWILWLEEGLGENLKHTGISEIELVSLTIDSYELPLMEY